MMRPTNPRRAGPANCRIGAATLTVLLTATIGGCASDGLGPDVAAFAPGEDVAALAVATTPNLERARAQFKAGYYGKAAKLYEATVETTPGHAEAWLGLAASYDHLRRFDLADRAYERVGELSGQSPAFLNNVGFSFYLRGDWDNARQMLSAAHHAAPGDAHIQNNIALLNDRLVALGKAPLVY